MIALPAGVTPEQARGVWIHEAEQAGKRGDIVAVLRAVTQLQLLTPEPPAPVMPPLPRRGVAGQRRPRKPCTECGGLGCVEGIECERCDGSCVEPASAVPTPGDLLLAVAEALDARKLPRVEVHSDRRGPRWIVVDGEVVANVKGSVIVARAVRDGLQHDRYILPEAQYTPTGDPEQAHGIALDLQVRHVSRVAERARLEAPHRPATYQPYEDRWPRYRVAAREDDAAEDRSFSELRADELTEAEIATLAPVEQEMVAVDRLAMEMEREPAAVLVRECAAEALLDAAE